MSAISKFFQNVVSEMRKVSWPTGRELRLYTITVIITVVLFSLFFMVIDFGIEQLIKLVI